MSSFGAVSGLALMRDAAGCIEVLHARGCGEIDHAHLEPLVQSFFQAPAPHAWLPGLGMQVCLPVELNGVLRGAVALGEPLNGHSYGDEERRLMALLVASAGVHLEKIDLLATVSATANTLARQVSALSIANNIALTVAARPGAARLHVLLLERIAGALQADHGALYVRSDTGWQLVADFHSQTSASQPPPSSPGDDSMCHDGQLAPASHALVAPMRFGQEYVGRLWVWRAPGRNAFDPQDGELLEFLANQAAIALENDRLFDTYLLQQKEQFRLRGMLEQYLPSSVAERLISGQISAPREGARLPASVLMVDLRGSTALINHVEPELMLRVLNRFLASVTDVIFAYQGSVDEFAGDSVLAFFGPPEPRPDDPLRAVLAAAELQRRLGRWLVDACQELAPALSLAIGAGIATGQVIVGNIGSPRRLEHAIVGSTVNLAARLTAKAPAGTIQIDEQTWRAVASPLGLIRRARCRRPRYLRLKGFQGVIPVYRLLEADLACLPDLAAPAL